MYYPLYSRAIHTSSQSIQMMGNGELEATDKGQINNFLESHNFVATKSLSSRKLLFGEIPSSQREIQK